MRFVALLVLIVGILSADTFKCQAYSVGGHRLPKKKKFISILSIEGNKLVSANERYNLIDTRGNYLVYKYSGKSPKLLGIHILIPKKHGDNIFTMKGYKPDYEKVAFKCIKEW